MPPLAKTDPVKTAPPRRHALQKYQVGRKILVTVALAIFCLIVRNVCFYLDITKPHSEMVSYGDEKCQHIVGFRSRGFEDVVYINETTAITCAGDLIHLFANSSYHLPFDSRGSQCALIIMVDELERATVAPLNMTSASGASFYPAGMFVDDHEGTPFEQRRLLHIHGIDVVAPRQRNGGESSSQVPLLFAVNHAFEFGGESVEVFEIHAERRQLVHVRTLQLNADQNLQFMGVLNDISVSTLTRTPLDDDASRQSDEGQQSLNNRPSESLEGSFFVSKYLEFAEDPRGRANAGVMGTLWQLLSKAVMHLRAVTSLFNTEVYRCSFSADVNAPLVCTPAITNMFMSNGMTMASLPVSKKNSLDVLVAVDVLAHRLLIHPADGPFPVSASNVAGVTLVHAVDNIVLNINALPECRHSKTQRGVVTCDISVYGGAVVSVLAASRIEHLQENSTYSPGGITRVDMEVDIVKRNSKYEVVAAQVVKETRVMITDGKKFHGISAGLAFHGDHLTTVVGSFKMEGFSMCRLERVKMIRPHL